MNELIHSRQAHYYSLSRIEYNKHYNRTLDVYKYTPNKDNWHDKQTIVLLRQMTIQSPIHFLYPIWWEMTLTTNKNKKRNETWFFINIIWKWKSIQFASYHRLFGSFFCWIWNLSNLINTLNCFFAGDGLVVIEQWWTMLLKERNLA